MLEQFGPNTFIWIFDSTDIGEDLPDWAILVEGNDSQPTVPAVGGFTDPVLWRRKSPLAPAKPHSAPPAPVPAGKSLHACAVLWKNKPNSIYTKNTHHLCIIKVVGFFKHGKSLS